MTAHVLITGVGRSGTKYVSEVLNAAGIPCGHEQTFGIEWASGRRRPDWGCRIAEASWLAAPIAGELQNTLIIQLVRHPFMVIRSLSERRSICSQSGPYFGWYLKNGFRPSVSAQTHPLWFAAEVYLFWTSLLNGKYEIVFQVEEFGAPFITHIQNRLGIPEDYDVSEAAINLIKAPVNDSRTPRHKRAPIPTLSDFPDSITWELADRAAIFGYELPERDPA